jgi:exosortase
MPSRIRLPWAETTTTEKAVATGLLATFVATTCYLLPFWREQPELSHGFFALPCAIALLWQSRRESNVIADWSARSVQILEAALCVVGILIATVAALAALAQGIFHTQTAFLVGEAASVFALSGVVVLARSPARWVHLNGTSLAGVVLWSFVVPLPSGTLARITLLLQDMITAGSVRALHVLGFPAVRFGNVIQLPNTLVGVEEACSGIRSLTACLFAGVVLGGFMLTGIRRRVALVFAAAVLAILTNFFRSTSLCVMAARGVEINGFWHDSTALAVLGVTALALFALSLLFAPKLATNTAAGSTAVIAPRASPVGAHLVLGSVIVLLVAMVVVKLSPTSATERPPPDLGALLVMDDFGWRRHSDESIFQYSRALNTPYLRQETYLRGEVQLTFYVAYWAADQSTLGSVALHTPEICLPGSGWTIRPTPPALAAYPLPSPNRFSFEKDAYPQHVWFWHFFNGEPVSGARGLYPWQLAPALLKRGIRARAPQWVVRVSSNQPLETLRDEPIMHEFFRRLKTAGLGAHTGVP